MYSNIMNLPASVNLTSCANLYNTSGGDRVPAWVNRYTIQAVCMSGMVISQYILRIMASEGNKEAAETLILGVYRAIFWFVCFITVIAAVPYTYYQSIDER
jgi:Ni,Fe-hydrogenase I cytochrome b subunit